MQDHSAQRLPHVRIGVTGHRVLTELPRIVAGVRGALEQIEQAWPGRALTVVSSLAAGADQIVVDEVLRRPNTRLLAVLPLAPDDYAHEFPSAESRAHLFELLARAAETSVIPAAPGRGRSRAYLRAGEEVLEQCDVLLAVWDGRAEHGEGGTAQIVRQARALGKPLVIVRGGNRRPGTLEPTTLGREQGRIIVERLPG